MAVTCISTYVHAGGLGSVQSFLQEESRRLGLRHGQRAGDLHGSKRYRERQVLVVVFRSGLLSVPRPRQHPLPPAAAAVVFRPPQRGGRRLPQRLLRHGVAAAQRHLGLPRAAARRRQQWRPGGGKRRRAMRRWGPDGARAGGALQFQQLDADVITVPQKLAS
jgi:hypothetical protein